MKRKKYLKFFFCAFQVMPESYLPFLYVSRDGYEFYIAQLEEWIKIENPKFVAWYFYSNTL